MDEQNKHSAAPAPSESGKPAETSKRRRSHLPVVHVAEKKPRGPVFDTHYFLTALTHMFVALAALGFAVYMIVQLVGDLTPTVTTSPATLTSESESEAATAYVIRDEKVITSGASGSLLYTVPDGARVASGEVAIFVYPASDEEKNRRLEEIAAEKALLEYALAESGAAPCVAGDAFCAVRDGRLFAAIGITPKDPIGEKALLRCKTPPATDRIFADLLLEV